MNKEESLALYAEGKDAWNAWARDMLAKKAELEAAGELGGHWDPDERNEATKAWHEAARAEFSEHTFEENADFSGFTFPGEAWFRVATFTGIAAFHGANFLGEAWFNHTSFSFYAGFDEVSFSGGTWFQGATFKENAGFHRASFSKNAWFIEAIFTGGAWFNEGSFCGNAGFRDATFSGGAWFHKTSFKGDAGFVGTNFEGYAAFNNAIILRDAWFTQARFEGRTVFDHATFEEAAIFGAIEAKTAYSLAGATFRAVPDFIQAHFQEAPRLDNCQIKAPKKRFKDWFKGDPNLAARWRALKRLAIQGHDHAREQEYFKGELLARRWGDDKWWHAVFWFGVLYGSLSDFGRSIVRPMLWWFASVFVFAGLYLSEHADFVKQSFLGIAQAAWSLIHWIGWWVIDGVTGYSRQTPLPACAEGSGDAPAAALMLAFQKGLLVLGLVPADKLNRIFACLYGIHDPPPTGQPADLPPRFAPVIPDAVTWLGFLQHPLSAVLIFLLLLAVRNHFRIK